MSQNNNDNSAVIVFAMVGACMFVLAAMIAIGLAFLAFVLTIVCAFVWQFEKTLTLGPITIDPDEAGAFILRGLAGALLLPGFALFAKLFFGVQLRDDIWGYLFGAGYVLGSLGVEWLMAQAEANGHRFAPPRPVIDHDPPLFPELPSPSEPADKPSFRFASWDDEEELRR